jgi:hypothetical protein
LAGTSVSRGIINNRFTKSIVNLAALTVQKRAQAFYAPACGAAHHETAFSLYFT